MQVQLVCKSTPLPHSTRTIWSWIGQSPKQNPDRQRGAQGPNGQRVQGWKKGDKRGSKGEKRGSRGLRHTSRVWCALADHVD